MGQLTIYLDEQTQKKARRAAKREGKSLSRWAREQLNEAADEGQTWPSGYFELMGASANPPWKLLLSFRTTMMTNGNRFDLLLRYKHRDLRAQPIE